MPSINPNCSVDNFPVGYLQRKMAEETGIELECDKRQREQEERDAAVEQASLEREAKEILELREKLRKLEEHLAAKKILTSDKKA